MTNEVFGQNGHAQNGHVATDSPESQDGRGAMTLEGLAHLYENNAYNAARELSDMSGDLYKIAAKANLSDRERDLYLRIIASIQLERMGHLDEEELILAHMALGVSVEGQRAADIVTIATGAFRGLADGAERMGRGMRSAWNRSRRW